MITAGVWLESHIDDFNQRRLPISSVREGVGKSSRFTFPDDFPNEADREIVKEYRRLRIKGADVPEEIGRTLLLLHQFAQLVWMADWQRRKTAQESV